MHNLTDAQINEILAAKGNKTLAVTDPERLKVRVAPTEFINGGKATLSLFFNGQKDPELLISEEIASDPIKLNKVIAWAKATLQRRC